MEIKTAPGQELRKNKLVCPNCGHTINDANFCSYCSRKIVNICDCWVLKRPFNCGMERCPGFKLLTNVKLLAAEVHQGKNCR